MYEDISLQPKPLLYDEEDKTPRFYGSWFIEHSLVYSLYKYTYQSTYFEIDDIKIPIRELE